MPPFSRRIVGVGTPTGQENQNSNPGFGQTVGPAQLTDPNIGLEYSRKTVSTFNVALGVAVVNQVVNQNGTFLWYASAVDATNVVLFNRPILIRFDNTRANAIRFIPGMSISGVPFDKIYVDVPSGYTAGDLGQLLFTVDSPDDRVRIE